MNSSNLLRDLALLDLGDDAHPADVAYHVAWLEGMTQAEFETYCASLETS